MTGAALLAVLPMLDLSSAERAEVASAIRKVIAIAGMPAEMVSFDCAPLNRLLHTAPPRVLGLSPDRHRRIVSLLRNPLRQLGVHAPLEKGAGSLTPAWASLYESLADLPYRQMPLIGFMRFCSGSGIPPGAVTSATLSDYEAWCTSQTLDRDPAGKARRTASNWTWARENVPGWPDGALTRPAMREHYTRPLDAYPKAFVAKVKRFEERLGCANPEDIFDDEAAWSDPVLPFTGHRSGRSRRRALRPRTIQTRVQGIVFAAAALVHGGLPIESITSLNDLVSPKERVKEILSFHIKRQQRKRDEQAALAGRAPAAGPNASAHLANIAEVLRQIACFHCDPPLPLADIKAITAWAKRVTPPQQLTMTPKNRERLRRLVVPHTRAMLLHLPQELMRQATETDEFGKPKLKPKVAATKALYALALEVLLICPMRRANLASLRLDTHLVRADPRTRTITDIQVDTSEVKNSRAIDWPIPDGTARMIETFIATYRPLLLDGCPNAHLFPGSEGRSRNMVEFGTALSELITREIGAEINTHLLRHFAAWNHLKRHPGEYEIVRQVLGHASVKTVIAAYAGLEQEAAAHYVNTNFLDDRRETEMMAKAAFRRGRGRPRKPANPEART